jgi:phosphoglycerate dehydrogenase-like enzyme
MLVHMEPKQEVISSLQEQYPGVKIHWRSVKETRLSIDDIPQEIWDTATIVWGFEIPENAVLPKLRFVQLSSAGADHWATNRHYQDPKVLFCTSNGAHP